MDLLIIALAAFLVSGLTLYSGFGLGTLLLPVFTFFLPVEGYGGGYRLGSWCQQHPQGQWVMIAVGCMAAFAGVLAGKRYLHTVTMQAIQTITGLLLLGIAAALLTGIL